MRNHFESAANYPITAGNFFISPDMAALIFYLNQLINKQMLRSIEI